MRAIFLDRDGVISENRPDHVKSWEEFQFIPGTFTALRWLHNAGFRVFVVTNQAAISRGLMSAAIIEDIHSRMITSITSQGGRIDEIRYCPHDSHDNCQCRKPKPGMLLDLAEKWQIDLSTSYMVGDAWTDIAAGRAAHCRCVMVRTGRGEEQLQTAEADQYPANFVAANLLQAVDWIIDQEQLVLTIPDGGLRERQVGASWHTALSVGG